MAHRLRKRRRTSLITPATHMETKRRDLLTAARTAVWTLRTKREAEKEPTCGEGSPRPTEAPGSRNSETPAPPASARPPGVLPAPRGGTLGSPRACLPCISGTPFNQSAATCPIQSELLPDNQSGSGSADQSELYDLDQSEPWELGRLV